MFSEELDCLKESQEYVLTQLKAINLIMNNTLNQTRAELNQLNDENDVLNETITKLQNQVQEKEVVIENFQKEE